MCLAACIFEVAASGKDFSNQIIFIIYFYTLTTELFLYCYFGQRLTNEVMYNKGRGVNSPLLKWYISSCVLKNCGFRARTKQEKQVGSAKPIKISSASFSSSIFLSLI